MKINEPIPPSISACGAKLRRSATQLVPALALVMALFGSGCASQQALHRSSLAPPESAAIPGREIVESGKREKIRFDETLKAYPVNRYVDPADPNLLHEAHLVYRKETATAWNLTPPSSTSNAAPLGLFPSEADVLPSAERDPRMGGHHLFMDALAEENDMLATENAKLRQEIEQLRAETAAPSKSVPPPVAAASPTPATPAAELLSAPLAKTNLPEKSRPLAGDVLPNLLPLPKVTPLLERAKASIQAAPNSTKPVPKASPSLAKEPLKSFTAASPTPLQPRPGDVFLSLGSPPKNSLLPVNSQALSLTLFPSASPPPKASPTPSASPSPPPQMTKRL